MNERFAKYKERWDALGKREQLALLIGASFVTFFILYELIWSPYLDAVENLRARVTDEQKTLQWMQAADQTMQQMQMNSQKNTKLSPVALLGVMQKEINTAGLTGELTSLKQSATDSVQMSFQKVEFDKLAALLTKTVKEQNVTVSQLSATADATPGLVTAEIVLKL